MKVCASVVQCTENESSEQENILLVWKSQGLDGTSFRHVQVDNGKDLKESGS